VHVLYYCSLVGVVQNLDFFLPPLNRTCFVPQLYIRRSLMSEYRTDLQTPGRCKVANTEEMNATVGLQVRIRSPPYHDLSTLIASLLSNSQTPESNNLGYRRSMVISIYWCSSLCQCLDLHRRVLPHGHGHPPCLPPTIHEIDILGALRRTPVLRPSHSPFETPRCPRCSSWSGSFPAPTSAYVHGPVVIRFSFSLAMRLPCEWLVPSHNFLPSQVMSQPLRSSPRAAYLAFQRCTYFNERFTSQLGFNFYFCYVYGRLVVKLDRVLDLGIPNRRQKPSSFVTFAVASIRH